MNDFKITDGVLEKYFGCEKNIVIPDDVKIIGKNCFSECEFIESVTITESVVEIKENAFCNCGALKKVNFAPRGSLEIIGESAFGCCNIEELVFPSSLRQIHRQAFCPVSNLKKLVLNDGLQYIGTCAFEGCEDLPEVFIPASVTRIDRLAFAYVSRMIAYAEAPSKPVGWVEDWNCDEFPCRVVWGCKRAKSAEETFPQESVKPQETIIPKTVTPQATKPESSQLQNATPVVKQQPSKRRKLSKYNILYIVILSVVFLLTLVLSIVGLINRSMSIVAPLGICGVAEFFVGIIMLVTAKKQLKVVCPVCGTKREHHREFLYTEEKDSSNLRSTNGVSGRAYYRQYRHHYRDTYTCPVCGEEYEEKVSLSGGAYSEYPDGSISDKRTPPKEF